MKVPRTPKDFDYVMWIEDNRFFVRIKRTNEVCEISPETMKFLRYEEKKIRRRAETDGKQKDNFMIDIDVLIDTLIYQNPEIYVLRKLSWEELIDKMTDKQYAVYVECLVEGKTLTEYARSVGITRKGASTHVQGIRNKAKKIFLD